jgi:two-component system, OmpR family, response regulator
MRILVVEDERGIADLVRHGLESEGYAVSCVHDGKAGELQALGNDFDLVLLDVRLPQKSGFDVLSAIRAGKPELPVIMLTALGETENKVEGLDRGADDYLAKPFAFEELLARIRAQLRRPVQRDATTLKAAGIELDLRTRRVRRNGVDIKLTAREFDLLVYMMRHANQVLSRSQLLSAVWGYDFDPGTNVVEVYIGYLRKKLGAGDNAAPIETVRSVGYRLVASPGV